MGCKLYVVTAKSLVSKQLMRHVKTLFQERIQKKYH